MTTIKIKSTDFATQGPFVIIEKADFDASKHEPFDEDDEAALAGAIKSGELVPSMAELLAARDALVARERELNEQAAALADQRAANDAEAQRLAGERAAAEKAAADKAAADAATEKATKKAADKAAADAAKA